MLQPQRPANRQRNVQTKTIPAPIGGWNQRDPLAEMDPKDAIQLDNWFPRTGDVISRKGSANWATGLPSQVNSLMVYAGTSSSTMFAASTTKIYDVTATGAVGAAVVTGLTSDKFQSVNISVSGGGKYLWCVNGADTAKMWDGASWTTPSVTGLSGALTTADMIHINVWKTRIFLVQKNSMSVWYLPTKAISGAASEIDFGSLFNRGGRIICTGTWTIDGGYGMDDNLVIITSKGQVAVYKGTDPAVAANFVLVGVYDIGSPIGNKCLSKFAGDMVILTLDGFEPLSASLTSTRTNNRIAISDKISGQVTQATTDYQSNFGWECIDFPTENMLIFNVPVNPGVESHQYVMNTLTGAWCRFLGWNANCFAIMNDVLYFGINGKVIKAWINNDDSGSNITAEAKAAFSYFDVQGQTKQWKMARPILSANANPSPLLGLNTDFDDTAPTSTSTFTGTVAKWDSATWDSSVWGGLQVFKDWQSINGYGYCAALRLKLSSNVLDVRWSATDYTYELGGVI